MMVVRMIMRGVGGLLIFDKNKNIKTKRFYHVHRVLTKLTKKKIRDDDDETPNGYIIGTTGRIQGSDPQLCQP